jgi:hypothetical protein
VALALVLGAHQDRRASAGRESDLGELGLRPGRLLDRVDDGQTAQLAAPTGLVAAPREAGDIAGLSPFSMFVVKSPEL